MAQCEDESVYKEPAVRGPSARRLSEIARSLGLDLEETELQAYQKTIASTLADTYQRLYELPDPKLPVKYPRTPGYRPTPEENPYNAWYYRCDIKGAPTGKLQSKTVAVKDSICVAGVPMMNGSLILEGFVPDVDATVVSRILDAGGNIVGKAVCENLCCSGGSHTSVTGPVVNPHNKTRMTNGSSSGSAALMRKMIQFSKTKAIQSISGLNEFKNVYECISRINYIIKYFISYFDNFYRVFTSENPVEDVLKVAGGHVDMALGGDQGGSIRIPAAACGIVGLKPTYGLVPYTGVMPIEFTLDHVGPMARTVYDTALMLEVIAGFDLGLDPRQPRDMCVPESYTSQLTGEISSLKIGVLKEGFGLPSSEADVDSLVREAADRLGATAGAKVEEVSIPMHLDGATRMMLDGAGYGTCAEMYHDTRLQQACARGLRTHPSHLPNTLKRTFMLGRYLLTEYNGIFYSKSQNLARELCKAYEKLLEEYDVLIMPTIPKKAPTFPSVNPSLEEYLEKAFESIPNTSPFDVTGHPALSINAGFCDGLPVGLMIVGRKFDEATVLNVAYAYEKIRDGSQ